MNNKQKKIMIHLMMNELVQEFEALSNSIKNANEQLDRVMPRSCQCDNQMLMRAGCQCGGV